ncbi:MAG: hypothetical protein R6X25_15010, partial [Candidatus Krumholzibacteriia bacterium]
RYGDLRGTGLATARLEEIVPWTRQGRVAALLVSTDQRVWGRVADDGSVEIHPERQPSDADLLDRAVVFGHQRGAVTYARPSAELPDGAPAVAILRY